MPRARFLFSLDLVLLLGVAFLQTPRSSGLAPHEWGAIAFALLAAVHIVLNARWFSDGLRHSAHSSRARVNLVLNGALFVVVVLTVFSGLMISEVLAPLVGLERSRLHVWLGFHSVVSTITLAIVGLHVALNWDWIVGVVRKRLVVQRVRFMPPMMVGRARVLAAARGVAAMTAIAVVVSAACFAIVNRTASQRDSGLITFGSLQTINNESNRGWSIIVEPGAWSSGQSLREGSLIFGREIGIALLSIGAAAVIGRTLLRLRLRPTA